VKGTKPILKTDAGALADVPAPPTWLSKEARAEWRRIMPDLVARRILTTADMGSVENYCVAIGNVRAAQKIIDAEGLTHGSRKHPAVAVQSDAMTIARQLAAELGLTPVSRSRPAMRNDNDDDDAADLGL
jgi:P27 family predicted phage terminase small subunit